MNLLFLTFQGGIAGSTYSITYLTSGLAKKGHNVYLGCHSDAMYWELLKDSGVHLIPMRFKGRFDLANIRHIRDIVQQYDIQLINAQSSYDRYTSVFARWMYKLPVALVHTRRQVSESWGGFLQNIVYHRGTDKVIAVSEGVKKTLIHKGIPSEHIKVIYNGTPPEKYANIDPGKTEKLREKFNIQKWDFVIGCVSRLKNQRQILKALQLIPFPVKVIFVGIEAPEDFKSDLEKLKGKHEIFFEGSVKPSETLNYYGLFSIKILASTMEGLSQALLESMALGIPVIATDYAGNPELVQDGINGFTFKDGDLNELADKITKLKCNDDIRQQFILKGKETALKNFSIDNTVENHENLFRHLLLKNEN
ncbi:MAG: glycosyltransferase family 4 protein [Cyclobacteriaceae bacterium]|nr:glycosyltransferase family 4 protein [Cyclobacteriaceae bacterium]